MRILAASLLSLTATFATAADDQFAAPMQAFLDNNIAAWANDAMLVDAINAQNLETADYSQDQIIALDNQWRGEVGSGYQPLVDHVLSHAAADFLRDQIGGSDGAITEVFVMDARGLNVAASHPTSDYWQGDEDKHIQTYLMGPSAVHFGDVEYDESTEAVQAQISISIKDPDTGEAIGAITVGVDLNALM